MHECHEDEGLGTAHVFATLTAPSFGPVHSRRTRGGRLLPCRPRRDANARRCPHGRDISCPLRHPEDDPWLGRPLCADCYDYPAAVLFNAYAPELWRRFTIYLARQLAARLGIIQKRLCSEVRARFVKVAEYQARGIVHFHAEHYQPPPGHYTTGLLCEAIEHAAASVSLDAGDGPHTRVLRFGAQTDTRPIRRAPEITATGHGLSVQAVANYIAKYATKTLNAPGVPHRPIRDTLRINRLPCSPHYRQMIRTAWDLGCPRALGDPRFRRWAHMLGYSGHYLTKSRRYSVTFGQLRAARTQHRRAQRAPDGERDPWGRQLDERVVLVLANWSYTGTGYRTNGDEQLALAAAARAREYDRWADHAA